MNLSFCPCVKWGEFLEKICIFQQWNMMKYKFALVGSYRVQWVWSCLSKYVKREKSEPHPQWTTVNGLSHTAGLHLCLTEHSDTLMFGQREEVWTELLSITAAVTLRKTFDFCELIMLVFYNDCTCGRRRILIPTLQWKVYKRMIKCLIPHI